jgi:hypothetical protein
VLVTALSDIACPVTLGSCLIDCSDLRICNSAMRVVAGQSANSLGRLPAL